MSSLIDETPAVTAAGRALSHRGTRLRSTPDYRALATTWIVALTIVRFVAAAQTPLGNGEAYYYAWSRFLDWGYWDHPPLVAWIARATTLVGVSEATVRLGPVLASGAFGILVYRLADRLFGSRAAFYSLVFVTALPVLMISSIVLNPEAPLAPLWVGFLLAVWGMRDGDERWRPLVAGALLGAAFLAKYTAVLLIPAALIFFALSKPARRWLRRPSFYGGAAVALAVVLPVLLWNHAHDWPALRLHVVERVTAAAPVAGENKINQLVTAVPGEDGVLQPAMRVLVGQLLSYSPILAPFLAFSLLRAFTRCRRDDRDLFLSAFGGPVLLVLLIAMTRLKDSEMHWTMMGVVPAAIAAGRDAVEGGVLGKVARGFMVAGAAMSAVLFALVAVHLNSPALLRFIPREHYDPHADLASELAGWDRVRPALARAVSDVGAEEEEDEEHEGADADKGEGVVFVSNHYSLCGRVLFELGDRPPVYCLGKRISAFDFFRRRHPPPGATVIALTTDVYESMPDELRGRRCAVTDQVDVERGGIRVAQYTIHVCLPARGDQ